MSEHLRIIRKVLEKMRTDKKKENTEYFIFLHILFWPRLRILTFYTFVLNESVAIPTKDDRTSITEDKVYRDVNLTVTDKQSTL